MPSPLLPKHVTLDVPVTDLQLLRRRLGTFVVGDGALSPFNSDVVRSSFNLSLVGRIKFWGRISHGGFRLFRLRRWGGMTVNPRSECHGSFHQHANGVRVAITVGIPRAMILTLAFFCVVVSIILAFAIAPGRLPWFGLFVPWAMALAEIGAALRFRGHAIKELTGVLTGAIVHPADRTSR